jgi:hypothetical protein
MLNPKTNERELAYIVKVSEAKELPGYDSVHYVKVLGWWCVAPKDIKAGDLVVYFEIDSKLPSNDSRFAFMEKRKYLVKTIKICKVVSQGLVLPLSDFPELKGCKEGDFVTDKLHVEKYDPEPVCENQCSKPKVSDFQRAMDRHKKFFKNPIVKYLMKYKPVRWLLAKVFVHKKDKDKCKWPEWLPKTGSERIQNLPHLFGCNDKYIITEKVDGASTSFILDEKNNYFVGSHNVIKNPEEGSDGGNYFKNNIWAESGAKYNMQELLKSLKIVHGLKTVAIQGETYGDKVQKRNYSLNNNKHDFVVFHIWFDGKRLPIKEMVKICEDRELPHVHVYDYDYKIPKSVEEIVNYVDSCKSAIDGGDIEGFVFYSQDGQQKFKCVSPNFLLKYHR